MRVLHSSIYTAPPHAIIIPTIISISCFAPKAPVRSGLRDNAELLIDTIKTQGVQKMN